MTGTTTGGGPVQTIDIVAVIDRNPIGIVQLQIFALCLATSIVDGFDTMVMSFLAPAISGEFHALPGTFGLVFSATLLGGAFGATTFGLLADRFGRKALILAAVAWFSVLTIGSVATNSIESLIIVRFLAGIGLGGAIPNILTLAGEYAPARRRSTVVSIVTWGTPLGAVFGGLAAGPMIQEWGWRSVLALAGLAPLVLWPCLLLGLPESVRFLAVRKSFRKDRLLQVLARVAPSEKFPVDAVPIISERATERAGLGALFRGGLAAGTILLSATMFMSLLLSFFLVNWTPTMLRSAGLPLNDAILGTVVLNLSGVVGSLFIARLVDGKSNGAAILGFTYLCAIASIVGAGLATRTGQARLGPVLMCLAASGFFLIGSQITLSALITNFFPTAIRATGVGFNNAFARFGSLLGPAVGGLLLGAGIDPSRLLIGSTLPGGLSAAFLFVLAVYQARSQRAPIGQVPLQVSATHR